MLARWASRATGRMLALKPAVHVHATSTSAWPWQTSKRAHTCAHTQTHMHTCKHTRKYTHARTLARHVLSGLKTLQTLYPYSKHSRGGAHAYSIPCARSKHGRRRAPHSPPPREALAAGTQVQQGQGKLLLLPRCPCCLCHLHTHK